MPLRLIRESAKGAYKSPVQTTSDAMSAVGDYAKRARAERRDRNIREATEFVKNRDVPAPKYTAQPSRTPNYEPTAIGAVRKLKNKTDEALRDMGE